VNNLKLMLIIKGIITEKMVNHAVVATYVWIGGGGELRSKVKVMPGKTSCTEVSEFPEWNFDGSSTNQAEGHYSEVCMRPKAFFRDPFGAKNCSNAYLVMCDTYYPDGTPVENNYRYWAEQVFKQGMDEEPWFGLEQEYFLIDAKTGYPLGFSPGMEPPRLGFQGPYYCSVGADRAFGRDIVDEHLDACLFAGIKISGTNGEVAPGQWEFQVGPCTGIEIGDHMSIARYLLWRIAEKHQATLNMEPKPIDNGHWNGSGCHINFSTKNMREGSYKRSGYDHIMSAVECLEKTHPEHMAVYGVGNEKRMTGLHETASFDHFSFGIANRGASVRIPAAAKKDGKGYFEDRRPAANIDPYLAPAKIFETCIVTPKKLVYATC
jgi:glutamine synthetase